MSREHSNPGFVMNVLRRIVAELRKAGITHLHVDDLERSLDRMGEKNGDNDRR